MSLELKTKKGFLIKLIRTRVGEERKLVKDLKIDKPSSFFFKMLGSFDILEIAPLSRLQEAVPFNTDERILSINSFLAYSVEKKSAKSLVRFFNEAINPAVVIAKLHESLFIKRGLKGLTQVASILADSLEKGAEGKILPFVSLGNHEIILWVQLEDLSKVFSYVEKIRGLKIEEVIPSFDKQNKKKSVIVNTTTIPLISYQNVIEPLKLNLLKGKVSPIVKIKCAPSHEKQLASLLPPKSFDVLGTTDLLCLWSKPITLKALVKFILTFRDDAPRNSVLNTNITLHSQVPLTKKIASSPTELSGPTTPAIFSRLGLLEKVNGINQFLICEISNIVSLINTQIGNRAFDQGSYEIVYSLLKYLNGLLVAYKESLDKKDRVHINRLENRLMAYANYIRISVNQQFSNKGYSDYSESGVIPSLASSLFRITKAISLIPEQLFGLISKSSIPEKLLNKSEKDRDLQYTREEYSLPWIGFLFLDLSEGYRIIDEGEIISVPYRDVFDFLNWITLSHEVAHGYYVRIEFPILEDEYFKKILPAVSSKIENETRSNFIFYVNDSTFELFANWFDFRHFFNGDLEFYLWSIWRTYIKIPRVHTFKLDYWGRSLFVALCAEWGEVNQKMGEIYHKPYSDIEYMQNVQNLFMEKFLVLYNKIKSRFKNEFYTISLNDHEMTFVCNIAYRNIYLCKILEEKYINSDLISSVNRRYKNLDRDINYITSGRIITSEIKNPFLLLREVLRYYYNEKRFDGQVDDHITTAFIFSFWETSRKYRRKVKV